MDNGLKGEKESSVTSLFTVFAFINIYHQLLIFAHACGIWAIKSK